MQNNNSGQQQPNNQQKNKPSIQQKAWYKLPWVWTLAAVVIVAIILSLGSRRHKEVSDEKNVPLATDQSSAIAPTTPVNMDSYDAMLKAYTGKLLLVSVDEKGACSSSPSTVTFAKGTKILIANNSAGSPLIEGMNRTLQFRPYSYRTVMLDTTGTYTVQCGGAPIATVTVQ